LEVGCGDGRLAARLSADGYDVTAIDLDGDVVAAARARGVHATKADWLAYADRATYDAILFTRSLHHIHDLDAAVVRCLDRLASDGLVVVDDFAIEAMDEATAEWFRDALVALLSLPQER